MPTKKTIEKAKEDKAEGKSASTQAGEFIREEIDRIKKGEHGARSPQQAIAIGLSEARRAGVDLPAPKKDKYSEETRHKAELDSQHGKEDPDHNADPKRSRATLKALKKEPTSSASHEALSNQAKAAAKARTPEERSASAKKAAATRKRNQATK